MPDFGIVKPGSTVEVFFNTYDSNDPSNSVIISAFVVGDVAVYKDAGTTQRASTAGFTLLDTDGINFDGTVGIHGVSIDLADNTTANFYEAGSRYTVIIGPFTVDGATGVSLVAATFRIGYPDALLNTTIATLASQVSFTLEEGPADNDALNGCRILIHDLASAVQIAQGVVSDYVGSTKTVTLKVDPAIFTMAAGDNVAFFIAALTATTPGNTLDVSATGEAGADMVQIGGSVQSATDLKDFADAGYDPATNSVEQVKVNDDMRGTDSVDTATMRGTDSAFLASSAPTNFGDMSISVTTGLVDITQTAADKAWLTAVRILTASTNFNDLSAAQVNAEVVDAINVDTHTLPGQAAPTANPTFVEMVTWIYKSFRNLEEQDSSEYRLFNDAGTVVDSKAPVSDDGTDFSKGEIVSGP